MALEDRALFDRKRDMRDFGGDARGGGEDDAGGREASGKSAGHERALRLDGAGHRPALADRDFLGGDVALHAARDMQLARRDDVACHLQVEAEDRGRRRLAGRDGSRFRFRAKHSREPP